ncbi:UDP-N-acetylmuramoyl-tripeptide--D-alanyl-D-alanine ligase [Thermocoleostomius sinensis]|uniref:UDP-N-acetylmuramoyl-tripeptide--D-alanyl-D-alanine ligase n=1 Tax=Thermocoleostomius sinensis A174 TaxID=2016057 RepID=A0A9E8ZDD4_9CYAN|nr:UDP-N-acetylmuramoyl-tripeptide--D-alanyl-D-alanine ligase [Thermocoleostomius sinensis]WAL59333.1 UDP-N-acetylmuramoyl-tripeptide--D-alanyl-D-alanine ligase [Thermocoleostomius sinensis A174]
MACSVSLSQLVSRLSAHSYLADSYLQTVATGINTDTRHLQPGDVFVALRGDRFDGHQFVTQAIAQGAVAAIVDHSFSETITLNETANLPILSVDNTLTAYQTIAQWWRSQFTMPVIAVTGSVGKTTTKELISAVLSTQGHVLKSQANFNNEIGVPKTLLELDTTHNFAVVEMGMRGMGEISLLSQIARPDIAVITNVGTAHIGRLGSEQAIAEAKCELLREMPAASVAVLNYDNSRLMETAARVWQGKTITYGLEGGDLQGKLLDAMTLQVEDVTLPLPLPGRHNAFNYLAALAVAKVLQIDWSPLMQGLSIELPQGRARRYALPNDIVLLDETYNAGLESMTAALQLLADTPAKRRIAVLGTMKELGDRSIAFHQQVGALVQQLNLDGLLILADAAESQALAEGAWPLAAEQFSHPDAVVQRLTALMQPGDRILFKASRAVGLDQVVDRIRTHPQNQDLG